jgi:alanine dehydrogenase
MIIGTNRETKAQEYRVGLLPDGVEALTARGHGVLVQRGAGAAAGFTDAAYAGAGATLVDDGAEVFEKADLVVKVKEPMAWEYGLMRPGQVLFTYIHSAGNRPLCDALTQSGVRGLAFEDVETDDGRLPLLEPMSMVAGYLGMLRGIDLLSALCGNPGLLPGGLPGVRPARVLVLGGGFVGRGALKVAHGLGADVTVLDLDPDVLARLALEFPRARTLLSTPANLRRALKDTDLLLNAVMWPPGRSGHLVTRAMVRDMPSHAVIVDVSADIGGAIETCLRQTTHDDPTYVEEGRTHYVVANIPSAAGRSSSEALSAVTLPWVMRLADQGFARALLAHPPLLRGLTCMDGHIVRAQTARWLGCDALGAGPVRATLQAELDAAT